MHEYNIYDIIFSLLNIVYKKDNLQFNTDICKKKKKTIKKAITQHPSLSLSIRCKGNIR